MVRILAVLSLALLFSVAPALADTVQYDAVNDFSATSNPNGAWSYLMDGTSFTVRSCPIAAGIICWWNGVPSQFTDHLEKHNQLPGAREWHCATFSRRAEHGS